MKTSRTCDESCPGDCDMSLWSKWSECGKNCFGNSSKCKYLFFYDDRQDKGVPVALVDGWYSLSHCYVNFENISWAKK